MAINAGLKTLGSGLFRRVVCSAVDACGKREGLSALPVLHAHAAHPSLSALSPLSPGSSSSPPRRTFVSTPALGNSRSTKRFYDSVSIASGGPNSFEILLDGKKLKTPSGNVLSVPNHSLAVAVATEWDSQLENVSPASMHLTSLCCTACDNPNRKTKVDLAQDFLQYIEADTLCYRVESPSETDAYYLSKSEMVALQEGLWDPLLEWFCCTYDVSITSTQSIIGPTVPEATIDKMTQHMISQSQEALFGFVFAVESLKSVVLALAVMDGRVGVEEAVNLSRLEVDYQTKQWGNVEWHHDVEKFDTQARVAASVLFVTLIRHKETKVTKMAAL